MKADLDLTLAMARKIDFTVLNSRTTCKLRKAVGKKLIKNIRKVLVHLAKDEGYNAFIHWVTASPKGVFDTVARKQKATHVIAQIMQRGNQQAEKPVSALPEIPAAKPQTLFPTIDFKNADLNEELQQLTTNWWRAHNLPVNTSEDRFLLDQIAGTYLPDS